MFMRLGRCDEYVNHDFFYRASWLDDSEAPCGLCHLILKDDEQHRCEADDCLSEDVGQPAFFHECCMTQLDSGAICHLCAAADKLLHTGSEDAESSDLSGDAETRSDEYEGF
jgi:hypothetical protein